MNWSRVACTIARLDGGDLGNASRTINYNTMNRTPLEPTLKRLLSRYFVPTFIALLAASGVRAADAAKAFELNDGDRVAFVGNTFFEREQMTSYLETRLTTRWPDRNITFRNVGWSGDTVYGTARAYFEGPPQGFERIKKVTSEIKPTVLFVCYGMSESFDGPAGVKEFSSGYEKLLDMLAQNAAPNARFVLLTPIRHERLAPPLPDPSQHNASLKVYCDAIAELAKKRGATFVNLFDTVIPESSEPEKQPLTDNGIHLTPAGYLKAAGVVEDQLGLPSREWPAEKAGGEASNPVEKLRSLIVAKNFQFFNKYRPANETYIFLFRKGEQGRNAVEIPMFDKPISEKEAEIAKLRAPAAAEFVSKPR